jgi:hypothetical protein
LDFSLGFIDNEMDVDLSLEEIEEAFKNIIEPEKEILSSLRFGSTSKEEIDQHVRDRVPPNTKSKENWAVNTFRQWHSQWKVKLDGQLKIFNMLEEMSDSDLCYCLQFFIADVRKVSGERYPPKTLKAIFYMIQHFIQYECKRSISFFTSDIYKDARDVLDAEMRLSAQAGKVQPTKRAKQITIDDEDKLWNTGLLGSGSPKQLQQTIIFLMGIHLGLRASTEHKQLTFGNNSQLRLETKDEQETLVYTETVSKNKNFGLKQSRMEPKVVRILPNTARPERCLVSLYKKYLSHRPPTESDGPFHLSSKPSPKGSVWYKRQPLGIHQIESVTKDLMQRLGKDGYYTNTSLRRTSKSRLVEGGIPREVSKRRIGHLSGADVDYVSEEVMEKKISNVLYGQHTREEAVSERNSGCGASTRLTPVFNNCVFQNCNFSL